MNQVLIWNKNKISAQTAELAWFSFRFGGPFMNGLLNYQASFSKLCVCKSTPLKGMSEDKEYDVYLSLSLTEYCRQSLMFAELSMKWEVPI